jgi:hypothetical protein
MAISKCHLEAEIVYPRVVTLEKEDAFVLLPWSLFMSRFSNYRHETLRLVAISSPH